MNWPVIIVVAVCAILAVTVAYLVDSRRFNLRKQILSSPPQRSGLSGDLAPAYMTDDQIRAGSSLPPLTPDLIEAVERCVADTEPLPVGYCSPDFITEASSHRAVLESPVILLAEEATQFLDLSPAISVSRAQLTGFVLVARHISPDVTATLAMNAVAGKLRCLCVETEDLDPIAALTGATIASATDLRSGYCPPAWLGTCALWVSDEKNTWIQV